MESGNTDAGEFDYPFSMFGWEWNRDMAMRWAILSIAFLMLGLATAGYLVPANNITAHSILHHLNFLPLMVAGMIFGWRGAGWATLFAALVNAPVILHRWFFWRLDAEDQIVELAIFSAAGLIAGILSDRERAHRNSLEVTRHELERVYLELQASIVEMKKAERLSAAGRLAASLAHEIRNPLASISGAAGILQRGTARQEFLDDSLEIIQKESQRLNVLLTSFLNFARPRSLRLQKTNLEELLSSVLALSAHAAQLRRIQLQHTSDEYEIDCDPEQLKQVLLNLVINAIDASPDEAIIELRVKNESGGILIDVVDQGCGITSEVADHIFDPFFTTKSTGTGLGLAISSMIVNQHGGKLSFEANRSGGTTFRIYLPVRTESSDVH